MRKLTYYFIIISSLSLFSQYSYSQWFQLPNLPVSGTVYDMKFSSANTGWITLVTPFNTIKTSDGGMTWNTQFVGTDLKIGYMQFFNDNSGIALGSNSSNLTTMIKTTNSGTNWNIIHTDPNIFSHFYFVNQDTGWACGSNGSLGKIWKTTDGGQTFTLQFTAPTNFLTKLFFLKDKLNGEYVGWANYQTYFARTINSGANWASIPNNLNSMGGAVNDFYFKDTANGVISRQTNLINLTTNGGYNWKSTYEFNAGNGLVNGNKNTVWVSLRTDSIVKSTDFFQTYGKQKLPVYTAKLFAIDSMTVYGAAGPNVIVKTTNGGGPIIVSVQNQSETVSGYYLSQNFPNPFNPNTNISFKLQDPSYITLKVYNVKGEEVRTLVNEKRNGGNYSAQFDGSNLPSGVYFYKLQTESFSETKKMVLLK